MFYDFRQNNTGGNFVVDGARGISVNVIIEADSYSEAVERAEWIGLYWDGVESGSDCPCCGDRWYKSDFGPPPTGDPVPSIYGQPITEPVEAWYINWEDPETYVHYRDGHFEAFNRPSLPEEEEE